MTIMHWSNSRRNKRAGIYVEIYDTKQEREMKREIKRAGRNGWTVDNMTSTEGHINVGRAALQVALLSPLSLVFGTSRTKGKYTVTYRYMG